MLYSFQGLSKRQYDMIRFAVFRTMQAAEQQANAAAQDKEGKYFKEGAVKAFQDDAKVCVDILSIPMDISP